MKINKIDNGYTVEYAEDIKIELPDFETYKYHVFAFDGWSELVDWLRVNEGFVN